MARLKRILLRALAFAGLAAAALVLALAVLIAEPQWVLTPRTVSAAVLKFAKSWHPRWKTLDFKLRSESFAQKELILAARGLCFDNGAGTEGCLKAVDLDLGFRLHFFGAKLTKIARFDVEGDHLNLDQSKSVPTSEPKKKAGMPTRLPQLLPASLRGLRIEELRVDLPANEIKQAGGSLHAELKLGFDPSAARPLLLTVELEQRAKTARKKYHGRLSLDSDLLKADSLSYFDLEGSLDAEGVRARLQARVRQQGAQTLAFGLNVSADLPGRRVKAKLEGSQNGESLSLNGDGGVWQATGPVRSVQLKPFTLAVRLKKNSTDWDRITLNGLVEFEPEVFGVKTARRRLAKTLEGRLALDARSTPQALAKDHFDAALSLKVKPIIDWYEFHGSIDAKVSGRASQVGQLQISQKLSFGLAVAKFEDLVDYLAHTPYSIPAPICVLHGPLSVELNGSGDPRKDEQDFAYEFKSGLAAGRQALKFDVKGRLAASQLWSPSRSFKDETGVEVQDVALQLPRLDTKGLAPFTADNRIKNAEDSAKEDEEEQEAKAHPAASSASAVAVDLKIKTVKPAVLFSNLAKDPVPIELALKMKSPPGGLDGTVEVKPFRAEIFRRVASIDHIKLTGREGSAAMDIDGLIVYQADEAKILIRLLGNVQKPRVEFESDPPMQQSDIMALLLFGKSPDELDSDQTSSVANTQTAVANSAFGLASLYLLASTPVEYVGYDPVSRTYTVKFRLPGGATLQLGSGYQTKGVQLYKRIASHLALVTELTNTPAQGNVVTTLLEWFGRR